MAVFEFAAIGTEWHIEIYEELDPSAEAELLSRIRARIESFEAAYSRFRSDSLVALVARAAGTFVFPSDAERLFGLYRDLYERTDGSFTPLIGGMLVDAGYDAAYSLTQKKRLAPPPSWDDVIEYRAPNLVVRAPVSLDFGAAGKGYLIDLVGELLDAAGFGSTGKGYLIDAGGDILHKGTKPVRIGLEDPQDRSQAVGVYELANQSICGSAGNRRAWGDFTHIMDPKALASPKGIAAVWVVADSAAIADAMTTCLFFVEPSALSSAYRFEYALVRADRSIERSAGFSGQMF